MRGNRGFSLIELLVMTAIIMAAGAVFLASFRPVDADSEALRFVADVVEIREGVRTLVADNPSYENVTPDALHKIGKMPDGLYEQIGMLLRIPHTRHNQNMIVPVQYLGTINAAVAIVMLRPDLTPEYAAFCERYVAHLFHDVAGIRMGGVVLKQAPDDPFPSAATIRTACRATGAHLIVLT